VVVSGSGRRGVRLFFDEGRAQDLAHHGLTIALLLSEGRRAGRVFRGSALAGCVRVLALHWRRLLAAVLLIIRPASVALAVHLAGVLLGGVLLALLAGSVGRVLLAWATRVLLPGTAWLPRAQLRSGCLSVSPVVRHAFLSRRVHFGRRVVVVKWRGRIVKWRLVSALGRGAGARRRR
jgi:hypothetical protein